MLAPMTATGLSELHVMLASLLPDSVLRDLRLERGRQQAIAQINARSRIGHPSRRD
jgi:hypothetical protein